MTPGDGGGERGSLPFRYRYRTTALLGAWKGSVEDAARDAVRAGQAVPSVSCEHGIRWRVDGEIEQESCPQVPGEVGPT
jgi:hypothetical protein